ncbi:MAG: cysteine--tRNA ligase [Candidatus Omnitrophota bacterium]
MSIFIYNSLSGKKEEFLPIKAGKVNIYTCGVTVYDESHIGHARSLYIFDCFHRYLKYRGFDVNFVRNITDIDDKIINRAKESKIGWQDLVKKCIDRYYEDLKALGIEKADSEPRATENIPDMIKAITTLIKKGYAYVTDTGVYFSVRKFKDYGKLSGQSIEQMLTGTRKEPDETKEDPLDFALWKISKPDEPFWDSPWGKGRPGWHIECSVMSQKFLKTDTLDIHAGGRDLIFPHHENEIAQAEALTGKPFAKYWMHHGLLTINGHKMAKSLGNFITIRDFLKNEPSYKLKLIFISAHYRSPLDYNEKAIDIATANAETFDIFFRRVKGAKKNVNIHKEVEELKNKFIQALDDDFNTPIALSILLEMVSFGHKLIDQGNNEIALSISEVLRDLLVILNLGELKELAEGIVGYDEIVNELGNLQQKYQRDFEVFKIPSVNLTNRSDEIKNYSNLKDLFNALRNAARKSGNFSLADKIRADLANTGIILEDTKEGTIWRRKI